MSTTEQIIEAARQLGKQIAAHDAAQMVKQAVEKLKQDIEAQRVLNDHNRHLSTIAEKEAKGQPIEVEDKKRLGELQDLVIQNSVLRDFQVAQMDYLDLMRRVEAAMAGESQVSEGPAVGDPL